MLISIIRRQAIIKSLIFDLLWNKRSKTNSGKIISGKMKLSIGHHHKRPKGKGWRWFGSMTQLLLLLGSLTYLLSTDQMVRAETDVVGGGTSEASFGYTLALYSALTGINKEIQFKLTDNDWTQVLEGEWMIQFFDRCSAACVCFQHEWTNFVRASKALGIQHGTVDLSNRNNPPNPDLAKRFQITEFPAVFHVINGKFRKYEGPEAKAALLAFVADKKWELVEPLPYWHSPDSFIMGQYSFWTRLTSSLVEKCDKCGIPLWASVAIIAILIGLLSGIIIGIIFDCIFTIVEQRRERNAALARIWLARRTGTKG